MYASQSVKLESHVLVNAWKFFEHKIKENPGTARAARFIPAIVARHNILHSAERLSDRLNSDLSEATAPGDIVSEKLNHVLMMARSCVGWQC